MQNVTVNALLITSLLRTSLIHNDYYLKAQSWASLFSYSVDLSSETCGNKSNTTFVESLLPRPWIL